MAKIGAMIKPCPDCGEDVSTDAQACSHCGKPVSRPVATTAKVVFGIIGGILLAIALMLLSGVKSMLKRLIWRTGRNCRDFAIR